MAVSAMAGVPQEFLFCWTSPRCVGVAFGTRGVRSVLVVSQTKLDRFGHSSGRFEAIA